MGRESSRRRPSRSKPWYLRSRAQLDLVRRVVARHPSRLAVRVDDDHEVVLIEGTLRYDTGENVRVRVTLARNHPNGEPTTEDVDSLFPQTAAFHKFTDTDRLCLWLPPNSKWSADEAGLDRYLDELVRHVDRQLVCQADPEHRWPGPAHAHNGRAAYLEALNERFGPELTLALVERLMRGPSLGRNEPCPCHSGRKWKHCHRVTLDDFVRRSRGLIALRQVLGGS